METIVTVLHLLVALAIIGLILMQQGKGAEAGASFGGGASQTVFGSQGGSNFFAKATAICAFVFFATSFALAVIAKENTSISVIDGVPVIIQPAVEESEIPLAEGSASSVDELSLEIPVIDNTVSSAIDNISDNAESDVPVNEVLPAQ
jgi:preprotein translocase subunit SecG